MATTSKAPTDLIDFLDFYMQKVPFQIPDDAKRWIVNYGPWITVALLILALPPLLFALGIGAAITPFGGAVYAVGFTYLTIVLVIELGLMVAALPGLFAHKMAGWRLLFYSQVLGFVFSVLSGSLVGALIGVVIGMYVLFQVRPLYTA